MNYCVIIHAFGIARHKPEGQVPLQYLGLSYATITHVLEFSNKAGGGAGGGNQGQKLISSRKEGMKWDSCLELHTLPFKQYFHSKNLRMKFTGILLAISHSFEKTPQTCSSELGTAGSGKCFARSMGT